MSSRDRGRASSLSGLFLSGADPISEGSTPATSSFLKGPPSSPALPDTLHAKEGRGENGRAPMGSEGAAGSSGRSWGAHARAEPAGVGAPLSGGAGGAYHGRLLPHPFTSCLFER